MMDPKLAGMITWRAIRLCSRSSRSVCSLMPRWRTACLKMSSLKVPSAPWNAGILAISLSTSLSETTMPCFLPKTATATLSAKVSRIRSMPPSASSAFIDILGSSCLAFSSAAVAASLSVALSIRSSPTVATRSPPVTPPKVPTFATSPLAKASAMRMSIASATAAPNFDLMKLRIP